MDPWYVVFVFIIGLLCFLYAMKWDDLREMKVESEAVEGNLRKTIDSWTTTASRKDETIASLSRQLTEIREEWMSLNNRYVQLKKTMEAERESATRSHELRLTHAGSTNKLLDDLTGTLESFTAKFLELSDHCNPGGPATIPMQQEPSSEKEDDRYVDHVA